jgi:ATP-dependent DNA helicase RecG
VRGLSAAELASIQKEMIGLNNLSRPQYSPLLAIEEVDGKHILVIWVPGGDDRPYEVPESVRAKQKHWKHYLRRYASTIEAKGKDKDELLALADRTPFDDRPNSQAKLGDIDIVLVRDFLRKAESKLAEEMKDLSLEAVLGRMNLLVGPPEHQKLRNVALMLFNESPERFFPYSFIDIVDFRHGEGDRTFSEKRCFGSMQNQIKQALDYFQSSVILERVIKVPDQAEAIRVWSYPYRVLEEILVNAVYHRDYQEHEPISIRIEPDKIRIYNLGGLDRSIRLDDLIAGKAVPRRYRNRRLGDFLKEMRLAEGRLTGIQLIKTTLGRNGSPEPHFETDDERTWFSVMLYLHPAFSYEVPPVEALGSGSALKVLTELLHKALKADDQDDHQDNHQDNHQDESEELVGMMVQMLLFCIERERTREELLAHIGLKRYTQTVRRYLVPLEAIGWLEMTIPDKPNSRNQKYRLSAKALDAMQKAESQQ